MRDREKVKPAYQIPPGVQTGNGAPEVAYPSLDAQLHTSLGESYLCSYGRAEQSEMEKLGSGLYTTFVSLLKPRLRKPSHDVQGAENEISALHVGFLGDAGGSTNLSLVVAAPFGGDGSSRGRGQRRGEDVGHPLKISLEDLYSGTTKKLSLSRNVIYSKCNGSAIEILEADIIETKCDMNISAIDNGFSDQPTAAACEIPKMQENNVVLQEYVSRNILPIDS